MQRSIKITLGEQEFDVPALNLDQLQRVTEAFQTDKSAAEKGASPTSGFVCLRIALERATPKPDMETLAPQLAEIAAAVSAVLTMSGLQQPDANPQTAPGAS